jgi:hypothetical protein
VKISPEQLDNPPPRVRVILVISWPSGEVTVRDKHIPITDLLEGDGAMAEEWLIQINNFSQESGILNMNQRLVLVERNNRNEY